MAAVSEDRESLTVTIVNPTESEQNLNISLKDGVLPSQAEHWIITGPEIEARNVAGEGLPVKLETSSIKDLNGPIAIAPISINLYKFKLE